MTPYYKLHVHKQVDRPDLHYKNKQDHDKDKEELNEKGKLFKLLNHITRLYYKLGSQVERQRLI